LYIYICCFITKILFPTADQLHRYCGSDYFLQ